MNTHGTDEHKVTVGLPTRYELVDKDGITVNAVFLTGTAAGETATLLWPDQEQDADRTGRGWDVQIVGCE